MPKRYWICAGGMGHSWEMGWDTFEDAIGHIRGLLAGRSASYVILTGRHKGNADGTLYVAYRGRLGLLAMQKSKKLHHLTNPTLIPTGVPE